MAMSDRTPASIKSCVRICIGWEKLYPAPGACFWSAAFMSAISSSLTGLRGHWDTGFRNA
jgi:hypothetical protein